MSLYEEAQKIFKERYGGESMQSRQVKALADATQARLNDLEERLTTRIIQAVGKTGPEVERGRELGAPVVTEPPSD